MATQSCVDLQKEEREVLQSIYEGDDAFKALSETSFSYRVSKLTDIYNIVLPV